MVGQAESAPAPLRGVSPGLASAPVRNDENRRPLPVVGNFMAEGVKFKGCSNAKS